PDTSLLYCNATVTTELYTLSLHDALPISLFSRLKTRRSCIGQRPGTLLAAVVSLQFAHRSYRRVGSQMRPRVRPGGFQTAKGRPDRKSTRLNSSHVKNSHAVLCLKKKKNK